MKYSDQFMDWLVDLGYTHCFFVGGGNVMHLLESARTRMVCVPTAHEVAAGIAAEYFNESQTDSSKRAFAMVTAGPGLTNIVTAIGGAWLESRELLLIGGQAKTADLSRGFVRQIGHQEIDGVGIMRPITKESVLVESPMPFSELERLTELTRSGRSGPVFIEMCIDITAREVNEAPGSPNNLLSQHEAPSSEEIDLVIDMIKNAERPMFLFGGGLTRECVNSSLNLMNKVGIPAAMTWNGADRLPLSHRLNFGRPNTYGMRRGNLLIQQSDLVIALGTRLGLQQTGFAWEKFVPIGKLIQVDIDANELSKPSPAVDLPICADANTVFIEILKTLDEQDMVGRWNEWLDFGDEVSAMIPLKDSANEVKPEFIEAFDFVAELSNVLDEGDTVIPCSSGGAYTTMMAGFENKKNQIIITDKGLASMGYGLSGAIGASLARPESRTILVEGDGGFAQNFQEIGTAVAQNLNLKMFIFSNDGYASIRTMQRAYFNGNYAGCDAATGVVLPDWLALFAAYGVPAEVLNPIDPFAKESVKKLMNSTTPAAFIVPIDPEQTYWPRITSRITDSGSMESNPIHLMTPALNDQIARKALKYIYEAGLPVQ
jgi:acetolactate synthase-1/2/3 large subunit